METTIPTGSAELKSRVFRMESNQVHLVVIQKGHTSEHTLAIYDYYNKQWTVRIYAHSLSKEELDLIQSSFPVKGRQYPSEEESQKLTI